MMFASFLSLFSSRKNEGQEETKTQKNEVDVLFFIYSVSCLHHFDLNIFKSNPEWFTSTWILPIISHNYFSHGRNFLSHFNVNFPSSSPFNDSDGFFPVSRLCHQKSFESIFTKKVDHLFLHCHLKNP